MTSVVVSVDPDPSREGPGDHGHCGAGLDWGLGAPRGRARLPVHSSQLLFLLGVQSNKDHILVQWLPEAQVSPPRSSLNLKNYYQKAKYSSQLRRILDLKLRISTMRGSLFY